jgi:hypothetical protein
MRQRLDRSVRRSAYSEGRQDLFPRLVAHDFHHALPLCRVRPDGRDGTTAKALLDALANVVANSFLIKAVEIRSERRHQQILHASQMLSGPLFLFRLRGSGSQLFLLRFSASDHSESTGTEHTDAETLSEFASVHLTLLLKASTS